MKKAQMNKNLNEYAKHALIYLCDFCKNKSNILLCLQFNFSEVLYHYSLYHVIGFQSFIHVVTENLSQKEAPSIKRGPNKFIYFSKV